MTRLLGVLLVPAVALVAAACYETTSSQPAPPPPPATTEQPPAPTEPPAAPTAEQPPSGSAEAGKAVFASAGCGACHTLAAAGSSGTVGPDLDQAKPGAERVVDRVTNGKGAMPSFKDSLSEQQILDVAAFVSESAGK